MSDDIKDTIVDDAALATEIAASEAPAEHSADGTDEDLTFEVFASRCPSKT
ncbi:hypothetical protein [Stackebrandtia soli]|uniref:hypothetical protein n=1 Tax=Stackebrandtia soli TaxID=1892856 RepID=UPI0039ED15B0